MRNFRNEVVNIVSQNVDTSIAGENSELKEVLDHCINKLPEKMAFVITSGLHGISSNKVAEELCTTVAAVYNLNFRANQLLRKYVSEYK